MSRVMYDSTRPEDIPDGSPVVMGYVTDPRVGIGSWPAGAADTFRGQGRAVLLLCIYNDRVDANGIDIEQGDNNASGAAIWIREKWDAGGAKPIVYCETDAGVVGYRIADVVAECDAQGIPLPDFIVAAYDGIMAIPTYPDPRVRIIGKQYLHSGTGPHGSSGHYDVSVVVDQIEGVDVATQFVPKQEFEDYKVALQAELDQMKADIIAEAAAAAEAKYAPKGHGHNVSGTAS